MKRFLSAYLVAGITVTIMIYYLVPLFVETKYRQPQKTVIRWEKVERNQAAGYDDEYREIMESTETAPENTERVRPEEVPDERPAASPGETERLREELKKLSAKLRRLQKQHAEDIKDRNPYAAEYESVRKKHRAYWTEVETLTRKRDMASDAELVAYSDQLRKMKGRDIELARDLKNTKQKYLEWQKNHLGEETPEIIELKNMLKEARIRLGQLAK